MPPTTAPSPSPRPADHPAVESGRVGVLLVNLGTPDGTDYWSMRRYLKEFLSDRRVIEVPRAIWWVILNGIILTTRPARKGRDYATIWNRERNEGPLKTITRAQAERLAERLDRDDDRLVVDWAMRYGNPSIAERLDALLARGCERILVVPLYPQYAAATTATVADAAFDALKTMRRQPAVRIAPPWHDDPTYVSAIATSLANDLAALDWEPEVIVASFHGIPESYFEKGDPYFCHCAKTMRLLREATGYDETRLRMTFQSRFGKAEWLRPYTDETIAALARSGVRRLVAITPGFAADCLETIEEIGHENAEIFRAAGGEKFHRVACLNDGPLGLDVIETVVRRELGGWI
ncbi:ferrochelatase [Pinisolibacter aquiterrae]|uniref:ferrochelatase n=1 Tax=Pinisolibacter aquiterrae TaxID=2815579 RepID=UPI001C3D4F68|nr:ferrochelatase [Pinisolibacter aquiterrae]MBV5263658.1 ferrochelatase [Pinisolibacter aquiterrae]MCC8235144.1 ferrochelatase [Pinisolibacter aquiterrae]